MTLYSRDIAKDWKAETLQTTGSVILPVPRVVLTLDEIYDGVEMPPLSVREEEDWGEDDDWAEGEDQPGL